jgi:hypothetical protein
MTYSLKMQRGYDGSDSKWRGKESKDIPPEGAGTMGEIANGIEKGEMTYLLKVQSKYDGSDRKWHGKGRKDVHAEGAE